MDGGFTVYGSQRVYGLATRTAFDPSVNEASGVRSRFKCPSLTFVNVNFEEVGKGRRPQSIQATSLHSDIPRDLFESFSQKGCTWPLAGALG